MTSQIDYFDDGSGLGYEPLTKIEFTYNGNNLASQKIYSYESTTSSYTLEDTYTFEYDAKINPMKFSEEAMILGMSQFYSANNITKTTLVSVANPPDNFVANITYTYNSVNRPVTGTEVNGGTTSVTTFTYQ